MSLFDKLKRLFGAAPRNGDAARNGESEITCHDALVLVHEYLDGELEDVPEAEVKAHFDMCQLCYPHLHLERVYRDAVRRASAVPKAPPELRAKLVALLAEAESGD